AWEEALRAGGPPVGWASEAKRFRPPAPKFSRSAVSSSTGRSGHGPLFSGGVDPREVLGEKLVRAGEYGGFLALTLRGVYLPGVAEALASRYAVHPVHVCSEYVETFGEWIA